jgi:DNA-binding MarR family transcriptional regulator
MQIGKAEQIAGVSLTLVRDFFRYIVGWHRSSFELSQLQERLGLSMTSAVALVEELIARGYLAQGQNQDYALTDKGEELVRASASGKIKRRTAEQALDGLLKRAAEYNADPSKILTVDAIAVFGSFLSDKAQLGDLDLAVKWRDRIPDADRAKRAQAYAQRSGRQFSNFVEFLAWPETELFQILKARKRTIRIQDWQAFSRLVGKDSERCPYKVVFGDGERVKEEIDTDVDRRRAGK